MTDEKCIALDVERLAQAIDDSWVGSHVIQEATYLEAAEAIAAEYARLAAADEVP